MPLSVFGSFLDLLGKIVIRFTCPVTDFEKHQTTAEKHDSTQNPLTHTHAAETHSSDEKHRWNIEMVKNPTHVSERIGMYRMEADN